MTADAQVYLIDDDAAIRESLSFLLGTAGISTRSYDSPLRFLDACKALDYGCIITDMRMPAMNGLELFHKLKTMGISYPVIIITGHGDIPLAVEAIRAGVFDFIEKPFEDSVILDAVHRAITVALKSHAGDSEKAAIIKRCATLTERERQVLDGLVAGLANKMIAHNLGISPRTVEIYRANVMSKMQASSLSALVRMAISAGEAP